MRSPVSRGTATWVGNPMPWATGQRASGEAILAHPIASTGSPVRTESASENPLVAPTRSPARGSSRQRMARSPLRSSLALSTTSWRIRGSERRREISVPIRERASASCAFLTARSRASRSWRSCSFR
jgi:hypothetical protein